MSYWKMANFLRANNMQAILSSCRNWKYTLVTATKYEEQFKTKGTIFSSSVRRTTWATDSPRTPVQANVFISRPVLWLFPISMIHFTVVSLSKIKIIPNIWFIIWTGEIENTPQSPLLRDQQHFGKYPQWLSHAKLKTGRIVDIWCEYSGIWFPYLEHRDQSMALRLGFRRIRV